MNEFTVRLDLAKGKARQQQTVFVRQGDKNATTIVATITDHGAAASTSGLTARFAMRLPNGTHYYRKVASLSGNTATVTIDETQAASVAGRTDVAYFQLLQGSTVVASTESFTVVVLPDALADAEVAESYDSAIQDAIDALDAAVEQMPDMVEDVLADHPEWTTTVQDGSITKAKLATDLARDRERLLYRLDNMLTNALPEGETATATDAAKTPMAGLALYGRSTQDGTPTPSAPVSIVSVAGNLLDVARSGSRTDSGVTWTYNADGTVTVTGTATGNPWSHTSALEPAVTLPAGTYTASVSAPFGIVVQANGSSLYAGTNNAYAFTLSAESSVRVYARVVQGTTYTGETTGIMLTRGSTAYPYVPYGSVGLWARGRNLATITNRPATSNGINFTYNANGSITLSGTATAQSVIWLNSQALNLPASTYTMSVSGLQTGVVMQFAHQMESGGSITYDYGSSSGPSATFAIPSGYYMNDFRFVISNGVTVNTTVYVQIEVGSTATAYQPFAYTVTPVPLDGHELRSLPDGTRDEVTVGADGHAVLVQRVGTWDLSTLATSSRWGKSGSARNGFYIHYAAVSGIKPDMHGNVLCTVADGAASVSEYYSALNVAWIDTSVSLNLDATTVGSTVAAFKEWLATADVKLVAELATPVTIDLGYVDAVPLVGPDLTAQAIPSAPMQLTYERDLNTTLARLESAIATLA